MFIWTGTVYEELYTKLSCDLKTKIKEVTTVGQHKNMKAGIIELDLKIRFIKVWLSPSQKIVLFASMKVFKNYENAFYFTLKAFLVLNIFNAAVSGLR